MADRPTSLHARHLDQLRRTTGGEVIEPADVGPAETRLLYGDAKPARLAALKGAWDPENVVRRNPNVTPLAPGADR